MQTSLFSILALVASTCAFSAPPAPASPAEIALDVFKGVALGFAEDEFPDVSSCVSDLNSTYVDLKAAIEDFEKKTAKGIIDGLQEMGETLVSLVDALRSCKATVDEVEKMVKALEQFTSPAAFAYHVGKDLLVNGRDIFQEITTAVSNWKAAQYTDAGKQIGTALAKLIVGNELEFLSAAAPATLTDCGDSSYLAKISTGTFVPNPPAKGATNQISGSGTLSKQVSAGSGELTITADGITLVHKKNLDVCKDNTINLPMGAGSIKVQALPCPVPAGTVTMKETLVLKPFAPSGKYVATLKGVDPTSGSNIMCAQVNMQI